MKYNPFYALIVMLFFSVMVKCQDKVPSKFDQAYFRSFREEKVDKMLETGVSLYKNSQNELQKIKSLVIIASAYSRKLHTSKSIRYWKKIDSMGKAENLADWETLANERLAAEYLKLDMIDVSKQYLKRAFIVGKSLSGSLESRYIYALMLETEALQKISEKDTVGFIKGIKNNQDFLKKIPENDVRNYLVGKSYVKLGEVYVQMNKLDSADFSFQIAEKSLKNSKINLGSSESAALYKGFGNLALKRKQFEECEKYLLKARKISLADNNQELTDLIIKDLRRYYRLVYNYKGLYEINQIRDSLDLIKKNELVFVADKHFKDEFSSKSKFKNYMYIMLSTSILLVIFIVGLFLYHKKQKKKNAEQFKRIIEKLKATEEEEEEEEKKMQLSTESTSVAINNSEFDDEPLLQISSEKEEELVRLMKNFEKKHYYLDKHISKPKMASHLRTNTKYLSYIIKKYRNSNFSDYINSLRIRYIVKYLYTESQYRNYKISHLAELCGYSSHSRFAYIFKKEMDISPSEFINQIRNRTKNNQY